MFPIQLSEYIKLMPLEIAVFRNDVPMIHFLLEHGADPDLAQEQPLLLTTTRCCRPRWWRSLLDRPQNSARSRKSGPSRKYAGANARRISPCWRKPGSPYPSSAARHSGRLCPMDRPSLPNCCWEKGADINYHKPDMVFPYASHPRHRGRPL